MKKKHVLIIGNWCLPLPAIEGGAVETLVDEFLKYNIKNKNIMITVYSPKSNKISNELNKKYTNCEFRYVDTSSIKYKMQKILAFCLIIWYNKICYRKNDTILKGMLFQ